MRRLGGFWCKSTTFSDHQRFFDTRDPSDFVTFNISQTLGDVFRRPTVAASREPTPFVGSCYPGLGPLSGCHSLGRGSSRRRPTEPLMMPASR